VIAQSAGGHRPADNTISGIDNDVDQFGASPATSSRTAFGKSAPMPGSAPRRASFTSQFARRSLLRDAIWFS